MRHAMRKPVYKYRSTGRIKEILQNASSCVLDDVIETIAALAILISRLNTRIVRSEAMLPILFFYE